MNRLTGREDDDDDWYGWDGEEPAPWICAVVTDSGCELRMGTKDRRDEADDRDGSIGSKGSNADHKLDSGLDQIIEDEILEEKRQEHRDSEVYSSVVRAEKRKFPRKGDEGDFNGTVWTNFNGQDVEISAFNYRGDVKVQEEGDGAGFGICPEGVVSSLAGRLSGYATSGRHAPSRTRLVEIMEKLSGDEVVALHVPVGISTKDHGQPAYAGLAYVQFATSAGLQRALNREVVIGGRAIVVDPCNKEFVLERLIGVLQSFRGPRCVLSGNEEERRSMWRSKMNWWRSDPFEWSYRFQRMLEDPCVSERSE